MVENERLGQAAEVIITPGGKLRHSEGCYHAVVIMKDLIASKIQKFTTDKLPVWVLEKIEKHLEPDIEQLLEKKVTPKLVTEIMFKAWTEKPAAAAPDTSPQPEPSRKVKAQNPS